jgi:hypothetical protein
MEDLFKKASFNDRKRNYPLTERECYPIQAEPMFDFLKLRQAYYHFLDKLKDTYMKDEVPADVALERFLNYLLRLEKDVPIEQQKYQP